MTDTARYFMSAGEPNADSGDIAGTRHVPAGTLFAGTFAGTRPTPRASRGDILPRTITPLHAEASAPSRDVGPNHLRELV